MGVIIGYSFTEFETYRARLLFISILVFFVGGILLLVRLSAQIFIHRFSAKDIFYLVKYQVLVWIMSGILLLYLGETKIASALLLGLSIYAVFVMGFYWIKYGGRNKDPDPG